MMPDDDDHDIESAASTTTRTARSTHGGPHMQQYPTQQQILSHRRPTNTTPNQHQYQPQHLRHNSHSYSNDSHYQHQAGFVKSWKIDYEYGLDDYHTVFRTPHFVTDAEYQKHLRGELLLDGPSLFSNKLSSSSNNASSLSQPPIISNVACANFCFVFSLVATIILTFFGLLLDTQALYIPGTLPAIPVQSTVDVHGHIRNQQVYEYLIPDTERLPIATTAYRTAGLYFLCAMSAFYYLHRHGGPNGSYTSIPETTTATSLPTFVSHAAAHNDSLWQRMVRRVKRHARYRRNKMQEKKG
jgi:hypothetical protein